jgi:hypothetical protein
MEVNALMNRCRKRGDLSHEKKSNEGSAAVWMSATKNHAITTSVESVERKGVQG